jgi:hypothetical protein
MMTVRTGLKRELRVALSRRAQPVWFRVLKWTILIGLTAMYWREPYFWLWMAVALGLALSLHFVWRWKTKGWTEPWGGWNDVETANRIDSGGQRSDRRGGSSGPP